MTEYSVPGSSEADSPVEHQQDRFGRCAVCGRHTDHCAACHRGHDAGWTRFDSIKYNHLKGSGGDTVKDDKVPNRVDTGRSTVPPPTP